MNSETIEDIVTYLCEELGGDWLLTGGSLVKLGFDPRRGTEDVDLVRVRHSSLSDDVAKNRLFRWLIDRGLGPEWVNSAVEPFVREVPDWEQELVLFRSGSAGSVLRPNLTLFVYLKLRRGSEIDLADIQSLVPKCREKFDEKKFRQWAKPDLQKKLDRLRKKIGI